VVPSQNRGSISTPNILAGVACVSASDCIAVGGYANINAQGHTLAEIGAAA
jgi:hypothetical protein